MLPGLFPLLCFVNIMSVVFTFFQKLKKKNTKCSDLDLHNHSIQAEKFWVAVSSKQEKHFFFPDIFPKQTCHWHYLNMFQVSCTLYSFFGPHHTFVQVYDLCFHLFYLTPHLNFISVWNIFVHQLCPIIISQLICPLTANLWPGLLWTLCSYRELHLFCFICVSCFYFPPISHWHEDYMMWLPHPAPLCLLRMPHPLPHDLWSEVSKVSSSSGRDDLHFQKIFKCTFERHWNFLWTFYSSLRSWKTSYIKLTVFLDQWK